MEHNRIDFVETLRALFEGLRTGEYSLEYYASIVVGMLGTTDAEGLHRQYFGFTRFISRGITDGHLDVISPSGQFDNCSFHAIFQALGMHVDDLSIEYIRGVLELREGPLESSEFLGAVYKLFPLIAINIATVTYDGDFIEYGTSCSLTMESCIPTVEAMGTVQLLLIGSSESVNGGHFNITEALQGERDPLTDLFALYAHYGIMEDAVEGSRGLKREFADFIDN